MQGWKLHIFFFFTSLFYAQVESTAPPWMTFITSRVSIGLTTVFVDVGVCCTFCYLFGKLLINSLRCPTLIRFSTKYFKLQHLFVMAETNLLLLLHVPC